MNYTILLHSGGIDSSAVAAWLRPDLCFTINYGQASANAEIDAASAICRHLNLNHEVFHADFSSLGSGLLSQKKQLERAPSPEWWPYRNQLLATIAAMKAAQVGAAKIILGSVRSDNIHADGREEFYEKLSALVSQQELGVVVEAPAVKLSGIALVKKSKISIDLLPLTYSCHSGNVACSQCRGCYKRYRTFQELGI